MVLVSLNGARESARDAKRLSDVRQIQKALDMYYIDNDAYPTTSWVCSYHAHWQTGIVGAALSDYLAILPRDPINDSSPSTNEDALSYCYYSIGHGMPENGDWYMIVFGLEKENLAIDEADGVSDCEGDPAFDYGGDGGHRITWGRSCS